MKTLYLALAALLALGGCGADGEPTSPTKSGVSVSGDLQIGVSG